MPWDVGACIGSHHPNLQPRLIGADPRQPGSSRQSPRLRRHRATSSGSSTDSLVRQSLEFEPPATTQPLHHQPVIKVTAMTAVPMRAVPLGPQQQSPSPPSTSPQPPPQIEAPAEANKSSSGPINGAATGASVKRTHSLKDDLIKRFRSTFINGGGSGGIPRAAAAVDISHAVTEDHQGGQHHPQPPPSRGRPGSLRAGATSGAGGGAGNPALAKVLLDKKQLLNKANSSENLAQSSGSAADLNTLTSLVLRKRDRSQDSAESPGSPPHRPTQPRKAPPPPLSQPPPPATNWTPPQSSTPATGSGDSDDGGGGPHELPPGAAAKMKPPTGRREPSQLASPHGSQLQLLRPPSEDFLFLPPHILAAADADSLNGGRDSPAGSEDQQPLPQQPPADSGGGSMGHSRSSSFELLQDVVQSRTAPKIRQPSAIRKNSADSHLRDPSPSKVLGSSPPKAVSFNPTDEVLTYDGGNEYSGGGGRTRKSHQPRPPSQQRSSGHQGRLGDAALIDIHGAMVDMMENIVTNQRMFLTRVREGTISVSSYRENTKNLLALQTRTIQQILDAIQANEKPS